MYFIQSNILKFTWQKIDGGNTWNKLGNKLLIVNIRNQDKSGGSCSPLPQIWVIVVCYVGVHVFLTCLQSTVTYRWVPHLRPWPSSAMFVVFTVASRGARCTQKWRQENIFGKCKDRAEIFIGSKCGQNIFVQHILLQTAYFTPFSYIQNGFSIIHPIY